MSRMLLISTLALGALNVLAFGFWIFTSGPQLVISPVHGSNYLKRMRLFSAARFAARIRAALDRLRAFDLKSVLPAPRPTMTATHRASVGPSAAATAEEPAQPTLLEDWIDEIEDVESHDRVRFEGSEAWWRAWADSGGSLPPAAESCRIDPDRDAVSAASSR